MNLYSKFFLIVLATVALTGCHGGDDSKSPGAGPTKPEDTRATCVERQKQALAQTGLSLTGGVDEIKKLTGKDPAFYASLPYCSE